MFYHQQATKMCIAWYHTYVKAIRIKISMILLPQHRFKLQLIASSVANYLFHVLPQNSFRDLRNDTFKKDSFSGNFYILRHWKLISKERNPQRITTLKEYVNKQTMQIQVVITAITFYFIFTTSCCLLAQTFTTVSNHRFNNFIIISRTYYWRFYRL